MARTLDATLLAAQDNISRRPIVEILSQQATAEIPFDGQRLNSFQFSLTRGYSVGMVSNLCYHSSGRIVGVYAANYYQNQYYKFFYSDVARTEWSYVDEAWNNSSDRVGKRVHIIERTSDNNVLIAYKSTRYTSQDSVMNIAVMTPTGGFVSDAQIFILTYQEGDRLTDPTICKVGTNYWYLYFYKNSADDKWDLLYRTSTDGTTYGTETAITLPSVDDTKAIRYPSLFLATSGKLILTFDMEVDQTETGVIKYNVFWTESTDSGATWSAPVNITDDTTAGVSYGESRIAEYANEDIMISMTKKMGALVIEDQDFPDEYANEPIYHFYDHVADYLYVVCAWQGAGEKPINGIVKVDPATFTILKTYNESSTPAIPDIFCGQGNVGADHFWPEAHHWEYPYIAWHSYGSVCVFNISTETFTSYHFEDNATYSVETNILPEPTGMNANYHQYYDAMPRSITTDGTNHKCWISFGETSSMCELLTIGYIDLTETPDGEGNYTWHEVVAWEGYVDGALEDFTSFFLEGGNTYPRIMVPGDGVIYWVTRQCSVWVDSVGKYGGIFKFSESSGAHIETLHYGNMSGLPKNGFDSAFWYDRKIYGGVVWTDVENQGERVGVCVHDVDQRTTRYINMPDGAAYWGMRYDGDGGLMLYTTSGFYVMDIASEVWKAYTQDEIPELPNDSTYCIPAYNSNAEVYYIGENYIGNGNPFMAAVPKYGLFEQGQYIAGAIQGDDTYTHAEITPLTLGLQEDHIDITIDDNDSVWAVWSHQQIDPADEAHDLFYMLWDNEAGIFNLTDYLVAGKEVEASWSIAEPSQLKFTVSHGHLFDSSNVGSILSMHLKKGRKLTLRYGEDVSGNYWENQGTFFVIENKMSYQRDQYPTMTVVAKDRLANWQEGVIRATTHFADQYPEAVITSLITSYGEDYLTAADYSFPDLAWRHEIWHQFVDRTLWEMLEVLGDHFGFTPYVDMDGVIKLREIDLTLSIDHAYSDTTAVINYSPNDEYSTLINRITVLGETRSFTEVTYAYERMGNVSGTTGWWGDDADKKVWYSNDGTLEAVNPYLVVNESTDEFEIFILKGGGGEQISNIDQLNRYVEIEIESPNLVGVFLGTLASFIAVATRAAFCSVDCGPYVFATSMLSSVLINILGAVARYDIDVYAQPMGRERRSVQATADDVEFQAEIGRVVEEFIDDPLAYSQGSCQVVADREIAYATAQRKRIAFEKVAHLQDEVGDIVTLPHPQSAETVKLMITEIRRVMMRPAPGGTSGYFKDKIEGWRIT